MEEYDYWFCVLGILHGVRGEFTDDVSGAAVGNSPRTPCKVPKTKNQYSFRGKSLKSRKSMCSQTSLILKRCEHYNGVFAVTKGMLFDVC